MDDGRVVGGLLALLAELHGASTESCALKSPALEDALHELNASMRICVGPEAAGVPPCTPLGLDEEPDQCRHAASVAALWLDAGALQAGQAALEATACRMLAGDPAASCIANAGLALVSHAATALQRLVYGLEAGVLQPGDCAAGLGSATSNSSIATQAAPNGMSRPRAPDGAAGASRGAVARCTVSQLRARLAEQLTSPALAVAVADVVRACHLAPPPSLPIPPAAAAVTSSASSCASCGSSGGGSAGARSSGGGSSASCSPCSCCSPAASPASSSSPRSTSPRSSLDMARGPATGSGGIDCSVAWSEGHGEDATGGKGGASTSSGNSSSSSNVRTTAAALLGRARRACSGHACVASVLGMASGAAEADAADVAAGCGITAAASAAPSLLSTPHGACVLGRSSRYLYLMLWCAHDIAAAPGIAEPPGSEAEGADEHLACPGAGPAGVLRLVAALEASQLVEVLCAAYLDAPAPAPPPPPTPRPQPPTQPPQPAADAGSASAGGIRGRVLTQKELRKQKGKARGAKPHTAAATAAAKSSAQQPGDARLAAGSPQAVEEQDKEGTETDPHTALVRSLRHGLSSLAHATSLLATLASSLKATASGRTGSACGSSACLSGFGCSYGAALGMPCRSVELPPAPVAVRAAQLLLAPSAQRLQVSLLCHLAKGTALAAAAGMALEASPCSAWQPWCFGLLDLVYPHAPPPHQPPQPPQPPQAQQNSRGHACDKPGAGCRQQPRRDGHRAGTERLEADVAGEMEARAARDLALLPQLQPALLGWATLERLGLGEQLEAALADVAAVDAGAGGGTVRAHRGSSLGSGLGGALAGGRDCYDWVIPEVEEEPEGAAAWGASEGGTCSGGWAEDSNGGTGVSPGGPRRRGPLHLEATAAATEALCRLLRGDCGPPPSPVLLKHVAPLESVYDILQGAVSRRSCSSATTELQPLPLYACSNSSSSCSMPDFSQPVESPFAARREGGDAGLSGVVPAAWEALAVAAGVQAAEAEMELGVAAATAGAGGCVAKAFSGSSPQALQRLTRNMELCVVLARSAAAGGNSTAGGAAVRQPSSSEQTGEGGGAADRADGRLGDCLRRARWGPTLNSCLRLATRAAGLEQPGPQGPEARLGWRLLDVACELVALTPTAAMWAPQRSLPVDGQRYDMAAAADLSTLLLTLGKMAAASGRQIPSPAGAAKASPFSGHDEAGAEAGNPGLQEQLTAACKRTDRLLVACDAAVRSAVAALRDCSGGALTLAPLRGGGGGGGSAAGAGQQAASTSSTTAPAAGQMELLRGSAAACLRCGCAAAAQRLHASRALLLHHQQPAGDKPAAEEAGTEAETAVAHAVVWCRWLAVPLVSWLPSRQELLPARPLELLAAGRDALVGICGPDASRSGRSRAAAKGLAGAAAVAGAAVRDAVRSLAEHPGVGREVRDAWLGGGPTSSAEAPMAAGPAAGLLAELLNVLAQPSETAVPNGTEQQPLPKQQLQQGFSGGPQANTDGGSGHAQVVAGGGVLATTAPAAGAASAVSPSDSGASSAAVATRASSAPAPVSRAAATTAVAPDVAALLSQARMLTQLLRATSASPAVSAAWGGAGGLLCSALPLTVQPTLADVSSGSGCAGRSDKGGESGGSFTLNRGSTAGVAGCFGDCARYRVAHAAALSRARDLSSGV